MRLVPLVVCAGLAIAARAQVPTGFLIVAEDGNASSPGLRYVDPASGVVTPLRSVPGGTTVNVPRVGAVALDAANPDLIHVGGGLSTSISPGFQRVQVEGSRMLRMTTQPVQGPGALLSRLEVTTFGTLLAVPGGGLPGLWLLPPTGNLATALQLLPRAYEVAAHGRDAYVASWSAGQPSSIYAVDLSTAQARLLGATYAPIRALLAGPGGALVAGSDAGDLLLIDTVTGNPSLIASLGLGAIVALAGELGTGLFVLTDANEVHAWPAGGPPVYRSATRANDIAWGSVDHASLLVHGTACGPSGQVAAHFDYVNTPYLGNQNFALALVGGRAGAPGVLVLGASRTSYLGLGLPLDLAFLDMPGCSLLTDMLVTLPVVLNAGGGASVGLPIPNFQVFRGTRFDAQWFHLDPAANLRGLAASDGVEGIMR